ncbi:hypothetical protein VNO77_24841 [Canavalia gladiata]|uniref:Uncharacterized protein n=1 Tax=Canavalia gladiata TaxID=3824 RepID=A0AAN9LAE3_CANGL
MLETCISVISVSSRFLTTTLSRFICQILAIDKYAETVMYDSIIADSAPLRMPQLCRAPYCLLPECF